MGVCTTCNLLKTPDLNRIKVVEIQYQHKRSANQVKKLQSCVQKEIT